MVDVHGYPHVRGFKGANEVSDFFAGRIAFIDLRFVGGGFQRQDETQFLGFFMQLLNALAELPAGPWVQHAVKIVNDVRAGGIRRRIVHPPQFLFDGVHAERIVRRQGVSRQVAVHCPYFNAGAFDFLDAGTDIRMFPSEFNIIESGGFNFLQESQQIGRIAFTGKN